MKVFIVVAALVAVACAEVSLHAVFQAKWNNFKATHGKEYHRDEEPKRVQAFLQNAHHVESHNEKFAKGHVSFAVSHNQFSDMTHEEFKATMMGFKAPEGLQAEQNVTKFEVNPSLQAPSSCDWRSYNKKVKNQGQCGSCYSFAALGALEGMLSRKNGGRDYDLSEQNIVDCSGPQGNYGCNGGFMTATFKYIKQMGGVNYNQNYPYEGVVKQCRFNSNNKVGLASYAEIPYGSEQALEQALATVGPVAIALDASPRSFMMYSRGIFNEPQCNAQKLSHAVLAVGYGTENGTPYYLVKNSWGTGWGEGGYFKIIKGKNMCGICNMASYPTV
jgi:cathepsin L